MGCFKLIYHPEFLHLSREDALEKTDHETALPQGEKDARDENCVDYYPFGLTFNSYSRENSVPNRWKFQSQEHVDDLGLNWDSFKWRNHQPDIGRFFNIDPLAAKYVYNSPYAFSENKVVAHKELEGLESFPINGVYKSALLSDGVKRNVQAANQSGSNMIQINGGVQAAGIGIGGQVAGMKAGGSVQLATVGGGATSSGNSQIQGSLISLQGGVKGPGGYGAQGNLNVGNASLTNGQGSASLISANGDVKLPGLGNGSGSPSGGAPDVTSVSQKIVGDSNGSQSVSADSNGVVGVKVVLGNVWAEVKTDLGAAAGYVKDMVNAVGSFVGQVATTTQHPEQSTIVPPEVRQEP